MSKDKNATSDEKPESTSSATDDATEASGAEEEKATEDSDGSPDETENVAESGSEQENDEQAELEPTELELLKAELESLTTKFAELQKELSSVQNEVVYAESKRQNDLRLAREERTRMVNRAKRDMLTRLMPVADTFHQTANELEKIEKNEATDVIVSAVQMAMKAFDKALSGEGLEASNPIGESFDPQFHEAQATVPTDEKEPGTILDVLRVGYLLDGTVLRAPQVVVAAEPPASNSDSSSDDE